MGGRIALALLTCMWGQSLSEKRPLSSSPTEQGKDTFSAHSRTDGLHRASSLVSSLGGWHILQPNWLSHQIILQFRRRIAPYLVDIRRSSSFLHSIPWEKHSPPPEENQGVAHYLHLREAARCVFGLCHSSSLEFHISPFWHPYSVPHAPHLGESIETVWHPWAKTFIETHASFFHGQTSTQTALTSTLPSAHVRITAMQILGKRHPLRLAAEAETEYTSPAEKYLPMFVHLSSTYTLFHTRKGREIALSLELHNLLNAQSWTPAIFSSTFPSFGRELRVGVQGSW